MSMASANAKLSSLYPSLFDGPPAIPGNVTGLAKYKLQISSYYKRLKNLSFLFIELIGVLLLLGLIFINVDWVKATVTIIAILLALVLVYLVGVILY